MRTCPRCDFTGPEEDTVERDMRELHRAWHDLLGELYPLVDGLARWLDRLPRWMGFGR